jgi:hypothetical protein
VLEQLGSVQYVGTRANAALLKLIANSMLAIVATGAAELQVTGEKAGLDPNSPPTSYAEIVSDAQKISKLGHGIYGFSFAGNCQGCHGDDKWTISEVFYKPSVETNAALRSTSWTGIVAGSAEILKDVALTNKLLRLVNSPYFGIPGGVTDVIATASALPRSVSRQTRAAHGDRSSDKADRCVR